MKYAGVYSEGTIPANAVSTQLERTEQRGHKLVHYFHVWLPDPDAIPPAFADKPEPDRARIALLSKWLEFSKDVQASDAWGDEWLASLRRETENCLTLLKK